eukprot:scaffold83_cov246-Pinguiococcus_pyrenoidosus.AAC.3
MVRFPTETLEDLRAYSRGTVRSVETGHEDIVFCIVGVENLCVANGIRAPPERRRHGRDRSGTAAIFEPCWRGANRTAFRPSRCARGGAMGRAARARPGGQRAPAPERRGVAAGATACGRGYALHERVHRHAAAARQRHPGYGLPPHGFPLRWLHQLRDAHGPVLRPDALGDAAHFSMLGMSLRRQLQGRQPGVHPEPTLHRGLQLGGRADARPAVAGH